MADHRGKTGATGGFLIQSKRALLVCLVGLAGYVVWTFLTESERVPPPSGWWEDYVATNATPENRWKIRGQDYPVIVLPFEADRPPLSPMGDPEVFFDLSRDGFSEMTGWIAEGSALLVQRNDNASSLLDGSILAGNAGGTRGVASDLARHDTDGNGVIDAADAGYGDLGLWLDAEPFGKPETSEFRSLNQARIRSISLSPTGLDETQQGHKLRSSLSVVWNSGRETNAYEVLFKTNQQRLVSQMPSDLVLTTEMQEVPETLGLGMIPHSSLKLAGDPELLPQAKSLVTLLANQDVAGFEAAFEPYLWNIADVTDIASDTCGPGIDARRFAVLLKASAQFEPGIFSAQEGCPWPRPEVIDNYLLQYDRILARQAGQFLAQAVRAEGHPLAALAPMFDPSSHRLLSVDAFTDLTSEMTNIVQQGRIGAKEAAHILFMGGAMAFSSNGEIVRLATTAFRKTGLNWANFRISLHLALRSG